MSWLVVAKTMTFEYLQKVVLYDIDGPSLVIYRKFYLLATRVCFINVFAEVVVVAARDHLLVSS